MMHSAAKAEGRAGGKVILLGEHAVVHGAPALAMGLARGVRAAARRADGPLSLAAPAWGLKAFAGDGTPAGTALERLTDDLGLPARGVSLDISADIPARSGLGASAAMAVAVARALAAFFGATFSNDALFNAVQASETVFHGNPSGLDATLALEGGLLRYVRGERPVPIRADRPSILVVHSGEPGETRETVARFSARLETEPAAARERLAAMAATVEEGIDALVRGDAAALGRAMDRNHDELRWFGVSTPRLDRICETAREAGALGAKLTGGGGGGCAVCLVRAGDRAVAEALESAGFEVVIR